MGLGRNTTFLLTAGVMLQTSLVDVLKFNEGDFQGSQRAGEAQEGTLPQGRSDLLLLSESSGTGRGPAWRLWHS